MNGNLYSHLTFKEASYYILKLQLKLVEILEHLSVILFVYILLCLTLYYFVSRNERSKFKIRHTKLPTKASRVLLVTAHPDDECMFFGPTLLALKKRDDCQIFVLCLSRGE